MFFFYISFRILFVLVLIFSCYDLNKSDFVTVWTQRWNKLVTDLLEHKFDLRFFIAHWSTVPWSTNRPRYQTTACRLLR